MTDAGAIGTRRQREGWAALAALLKQARLRSRAKPKRPTNPCATWAQRRRARDEWQAPPADLDAPAP